MERWRVVFLAAFILLVILAEVMLLPSPTQEIPYSQFKQLVRAGKVADLKLSATTIQGTLLDTTAVPLTESREATPAVPQRFTTNRVDDPDLVAELEAQGIAFSGQPDSSWLVNLFSWLVPLFVLILFWSVYLRRIGAGTGGRQRHTA